MQTFHFFLSLIPKIKEYLDPGTGSLLIQIILAGVLGVGVAIRVFWKNIKQIFSKKKSIDEDYDPTIIDEDSKDK